MQLRTLGELKLDGATFTKPKPLLLLAYLALEGPSDRRHLAELFWPGAVNPLGNLNTVLSRLRQAAEGLIEADDVRAWTPLESDAQKLLHALERGDLETALELYGGRFLDGFYLRDWGAELEEWVYARREALAGHVREGLVRLAEREAGAGDFAAAAGKAEAAYLLPGAPEPSLDELRRLHTLLRAGESLQAVEVHKEAESHDLDLKLSVEAARSALHKGADTIEDKGMRNNLPVQPTRFVGREAEKAKIGALLTDPDCRLLTILGPGGIGKTRLSIEVASAQASRFDAGVAFVPFASVASPDFMIYAIADALDLAFYSQADPRAELLRYLHDKKLLLVLDNIEHLLGGVQLVSDILAAAPGTKVLATSRERLDLLSERVLELHGMPVPGDDAADPETYDAVRLFVQSASHRRLDFSLDEANLTSVRRICRLVEGLPLGLELAASWLNVLMPDAIVQELEQSLDVLQASSRDLPERHRSIRAVFDHSWGLISEAERAVLRKLSMFQSGFRREAAAAVAGASLPMLANLVDKSFISLTASGRYEQHTLLKQYIQETLAELPEERERIRQEHSRYYLGFARQRDRQLRTLERKATLQELEEERANLQTSLNWVVKDESAAELLDTETIWPLLELFFNRIKEGSEFFVQAGRDLSRDDPKQLPALGIILLCQSVFQNFLGDARGARDSIERGFELASRAQDLEALQFAWVMRGWVEWFGGAFQQGKEAFEQGMLLARSQNNIRYISLFLSGLAAVNSELTVPPESDSFYRQAMAELRGWNLFDLAKTQHFYAEYLLNNATPRPEAARELLEENLVLLEQLGDEIVHLYSLTYVGKASFMLGDYHRAQQQLDLAASKAADSDQLMLLLASTTLVRTTLALGDNARARQLLLRILEVDDFAASERALSAALLPLAEYHLAHEEWGLAAAYLELATKHPLTAASERVEAQTLLSSSRDKLSPAEREAARLAEGSASQDLEQLLGASLDHLRR